MSLIIRTKLDMTPGSSNRVVIPVNQYDTDVRLVFTLVSSADSTFHVESGSSASIRGTKTDGNGYSKAVSLSGDVVTVTVDEQMTAVAGQNEFEVVITKGSSKLSSQNFILQVARAALDKDTLVSGSEIRELVEIVDRTGEILQAASDMATAQAVLEEVEASVALNAHTVQTLASQVSDDAQSVASDKASIASTVSAGQTAIENAYEARAAQIAQDRADLIALANRKIEEIETAASDGAGEVTSAKDDALTEMDVLKQHVDNKAAQIQALTTSAETMAAVALQNSSNALNSVEEIGTDMDNLKRRLDAVEIREQTYIDEGEVDSDGNFWLLHNGERMQGPYEGFAGGGSGGGGGGGSSIMARFDVKNLTGWISTTISDGDDCNVTLQWSSIEDDMPTGGGTIRIMSASGHVFKMGPIEQGTIVENLKDYLTSGTNSIRITIFDIYNQSRTINFTITSVSLSMTSTFDPSTPYMGPVAFPYTPVGNVRKTIYFYLDSTLLGTVVTSASGREQSYMIPQQRHGVHKLQCYFEAEINGALVRSNTLYYELICLEQLNDNVIIASSFNRSTATQYMTLNVDYRVYNPLDLNTDVSIYVNDVLKSEGTVDRSNNVFAYRADVPGELEIKIVAGETERAWELTITESDIDVEAETEFLSLYLSSQGRDNTQANKSEWVYGTGANAIECQLTGFDYTSDGWVRDSDGIPVLRISGDDRVVVPFKMFERDRKDSGFTFEAEFSTNLVMNYNTPILSCMSGDRGIEMTPQKIVIKSEQSELSMQFKEDEHLRISFVCEKRSKNRLLYVYVDGILSGVVRYPSDDDFQQIAPVNLTIGSNDCTVDLYCIRFYENDLSRIQILNNWIADTQDVAEMIKRYERNNVYDDYGNVVIDKLPSDLPYYITVCEELPQYKGDKKTVEGIFVDPVDPTRSFTASNVQNDVQGTSSQYYERKNYKMKYKSGFLLTYNGNTISSFPIRDGAMGSKVICFKADVASIEGANNVLLARLANDANPYKTPAQLENELIRQCIDGIPIVMFHRDLENNTTFLGKYNMNVDKGDLPIFGFAEDDESWEIKNNTSLRVLWKSDDYETITHDEDGNEIPAWTLDFESRFPEDYFDPTQLKEFASWVKSTDRTAATGNALETPVTYGGVEYTNDTEAYRLAKFKAELDDYAEIDSSVFYYLFSELFLLSDSRAKNAFPSFMGSAVEVA